MARFAIAVHGGVGNTPANLDGCVAAAEIGASKLRDGGDALSAAVAAAVRLEDDGRFNAGRGSSLRTRMTRCVGSPLRSAPNGGGLANLSRSSLTRRSWGPRSRSSGKGGGPRSDAPKPGTRQHTRGRIAPPRTSLAGAESVPTLEVASGISGFPRRGTDVTRQNPLKKRQIDPLETGREKCHRPPRKKGLTNEWSAPRRSFPTR